MYFYEEKITITRKDLLNQSFDNFETIKDETVTEKPFETILCQMVKTILEKNMEVA